MKYVGPGEYNNEPDAADDKEFSAFVNQLAEALI